jgi:hypothetical protein
MRGQQLALFREKIKVNPDLWIRGEREILQIA